MMGQQGNKTLLQAFLRWMVRGAAEFRSKHPDGRFFSKGSLALGTRLDFTNYTSLLESAVLCIVVLALCCTFRAENVLRALS